MIAVDAARVSRLKFRAWHRGTREADYIVGGFFDAYHAAWSEKEFEWFEALLERDDADVLAWAMGKEEPPSQHSGPMMEAMQRLDYVSIR